MADYRDLAMRRWVVGMGKIPARITPDTLIYVEETAKSASAWRPAWNA
jgi:hypothetical protein